MEELIERTLEKDLSKGDKYNSESQCAFELSDEVLERIDNNDPKLTSLKLGAFNNTHRMHYHKSCFPYYIIRICVIRLGF